MSDEPKIEPCPMCKDESNTPFVYYYNQVVCPKCYLQGPRGDTAIAGIRAWNHLAMGIEIARATALQFAAESAAWDDENTTQQQHDKCLMVEQDAANSLSALLEKWRQTDG